MAMNPDDVSDAVLDVLDEAIEDLPLDEALDVCNAVASGVRVRIDGLKDDLGRSV